ncbi:MAG: hypothetical protein Ct9H300mP1_13230 [Planctomycetaceae bacterium]|nr:MAG: hypothetical protein Ct9H300mP1_13230 [Planctomycetaceae bacterium]
MGASYPDIIQMLVQAHANRMWRARLPSTPCREPVVFFSRGRGPEDRNTHDARLGQQHPPNPFSTVQSSTPGSADNSDTVRTGRR